MKKNILFITGTRADFGKLKPLMLKLDSDSRFHVHIFVTGMHLLSRYGTTVNEIKKSKFKNIFVFFNQMNSTSECMDLILANTIQGLSHFIREHHIDMIIVHGDRIESLAGAVVGVLNNILVSHIEGGEVSGTVDELLRHSISKLAHLHFVANDESKQRLIQMGEKDDVIFVIGSPDIDIMLSNSLPSITKVKKRYEIIFDEYFIFIYHPITTEQNILEKNVNIIISALRKSKKNFVVIYPNNDMGSEIIMKNLLKLSNNKKFKLIPSMRFEYFLALLKNSKGIIGNSSVGIREAPVFGLPTINIGTRQMNRFKYSTIIDVNENIREILNTINKSKDGNKPSFHFGDGSSSTKFIKLLKEKKIWQTKIQKHFQDQD